MNYRSSVVLARWTWGAGAQTKPINIDLTQPISRITINAELVNNGYTPTDHPAKALKGIELVDGGDVLFSMDGGACQALSFYGTKKQPFTLVNYIDNDSARSVYPLDFGRYLYDKIYALDPTRYKNLQLKLEIDRSLGGSTPDGAFLTVTADIFDEKLPSLLGVMQSKEVVSITPSDDLTEYVELPTDHPYRFVGIKACGEDEGAIVQVEDFKLSEDVDKHVIIDERTEQYLERITPLWPEWVEQICVRGTAAADRELFVTPTHNSQLVAVLGVYADSYCSQPWAGGQLKKLKSQLTQPYFGWCHGVCPHGMIPIVFGDIMDPEDFWNPSALKSLRLKMHSRNAADGGVCNETDSRTKIIVQQVRPY